MDQEVLEVRGAFEDHPGFVGKYVFGFRITVENWEKRVQCVPDFVEVGMILGDECRWVGGSRFLGGSGM